MIRPISRSAGAIVFFLRDLGWLLGTVVSAWAATRIGSGRHRAHGIAVGLLLLAAIVANMIMLPYPAGVTLGRARAPAA